MGHKNGKSSEEALADIRRSQDGGEHFGDVESTTRAEVTRLLTVAGLHIYGLAPTQPTPWEALSKAKGAWKRDRRPVQLDKERKDQRHSPWLITHKRARTYDPLACVSVDTTTGDFLVEMIAPAVGVTRDPSHDDLAAVVVDELRDLYEAHFRHVSTSEVRAMVTEAILGCWGGTRLKEDGHVYWLPASSGKASELRALGEEVVERIGSSYLRILELADSSKNRATVADGARESFEAEITSLLNEVRGDGSKLTVARSRESTFEDRLAQYEELRHRIELYASILGSRRDDLLRDLDEATDVVTEMLSGAGARREARRRRRAIEREREAGATDEEIEALRASFDAPPPDDATGADDAGDPPAPAPSRSADRRARRAASDHAPDATAAAANIGATIAAALS